MKENRTFFILSALFLLVPTDTMSMQSQEEVVGNFLRSSVEKFSAGGLLQDARPGFVVLVVINDIGKYNSAFNSVLSTLLEKKAKKILVSLSRPSSSIDPQILENFKVIDAASGLSSSKESPGRNVVMVKSPASLNELMMKISGSLDKGVIALFDSVAVLPVYNSEQDTMKFLHRLLSNTRKKGAIVILLSVPVAGSGRIKNFLMSMADKIFEV